MKLLSAKHVMVALLVSAGLIAVIGPISAYAEEATASQPAMTPQPAAPDPTDLAALALQRQGGQLMMSGNRPEALKQFQQMAALYETRYHDPAMTYYSARTPAESLMYLAQAANAKHAAQVRSALWGYAYFLQAFVLIDMQQGEQAQALLEHAVQLSPSNAQFLAELANLYSQQKQWDKALDYYRRAADASSLSPDTIKNSDLARAWRGTAFVDVELGKLDDAEHIYLKCLNLNANDTKAKNELAYVRQRRQQAITPAS